MLPPDTLVLTPTGSLPVGSLESGAPLCAYQGDRTLGEVRLQETRPENSPAVVRMTTLGGRFLTLLPDHPVFGWLRPTRRYFDIFLMERAGLGMFLGVGNGMFRDLEEIPFVYERSHIADTEVEERIWMIDCREDLDEAVFEEQRLGLEYGLPIMDLEPRLRGTGIDPAEIRRLLEEVHTLWRGRKLLEDLDLEAPHFERKLLSDERARSRSLMRTLYYANAGVTGSGGGGPRHRLEIIPFTEGIRMGHGRLTHLRPQAILQEVFETRVELARSRARRMEEPGRDTCESMMFPGHDDPAFAWTAAGLRPGMALPVLESGRIQKDEIAQVRLEPGPFPLMELKLEGEGLIAVEQILIPVPLPLP